jgi:hypothetical protein
VVISVNTINHWSFIADAACVCRGFFFPSFIYGPGSSVGIAIGWTVRGSNLGGGEIFRTRPDRSWGPPSLLCNGYRVFPGGKAAGAWC